MKRDNQTLRRKVGLRTAVMRDLAEAGVRAPVVLETHGGWGVIAKHCYAEVEQGIVFEKDPRRAIALARNRPAWAVYEADSTVALAAGVGGHLPVTLLDVDPYGDPWPTIDAFFSSERVRPEVLGVAVNDGLRQKLSPTGGWDVSSMAGVVRKYGNAVIHDRYVEMCRELLEAKAAHVGYRLERWTGYYCGFQDHMTHYGAIMVRP